MVSGIETCYGNPVIGTKLKKMEDLDELQFQHDDFSWPDRCRI